MPSMNTLTITIGILGLLVVVLGMFLGMTMYRIKQLTRGQSGSLESIIKENNRLVKDALATLQKQHLEITQIQEDAMNAIHNIGVVRFNPFKETGGNQSFAVALTDKKNNGVIISSLYARERINVFAKPIENGQSSYTLTDEEKAALAQSKQ